MWPLNTTGFGTVDHDHHRARRAPMARHFSRQRMLRLAPAIHRQLQYLCDKLLREATGAAPGGGRPPPLDVTVAYSCFTSDVISGYSFGEPLGLLTQAGWEPNWRQATYAFLDTTFMFRYVPVMKRLAAVGTFFARRGWMGPDVEMLTVAMYDRIPGMIAKTRDAHAAGLLSSLSSSSSSSSPSAPAGGEEEQALYVDILTSKALPDEEKTMPRLAAEGMALMNAGTETTSWTLSVITFHLLAQPAALRRLTAELAAAAPDPRRLSWPALEGLPYLHGVVMEGLRLGYGVSARSARVATEEDLVYRGPGPEGEGGMKKTKRFEYVIPRGWAIGMSSVLVHHDERVFPESDKFLPERWIDAEGNRNRELEKYLMSFSRGSRACLGMMWVKPFFSSFFFFFSPRQQKSPPTSCYTYLLTCPILSH